MPGNPASRLRRPRVPRHVPELLPAATDQRVLNAATSERDKLGLLILLDTGVRRGELSGVRVRDLDLARRTITVTGKGRKTRVIPLRSRIVEAADRYLMTPLPFLDRLPELDDYVLYPEKRTPDRRVYWADPKKRMAQNTIRRWWYRQLEAAGIVSHGVRSGLNMHRTRHTFARDVRRAHPDIGAVQHLLGHSDPSTTIALYGGYDQTDLERAMEAFAGRPDTSVPPGHSGDPHR